MPRTRGEAITVCFTPSGRHERYPLDHKLYWHSKGYETTMRTLERLAAKYPIQLEVINGNQVSHVRLDLEEYIGGDIVPKLVEQNQRNFGNSKRRFLHLDITSDYLPQVDLILSRDCLVHFPFSEISAALKNFKSSQSTYLLTTTFTGPRPNLDIPMGEWRTLNLQMPPFNFHPPLRLINEKCTENNGTYADKCLGLWRLEDLRV